MAKYMIADGAGTAVAGPVRYSPGDNWSPPAGTVVVEWADGAKVGAVWDGAVWAEPVDKQTKDEKRAEALLQVDTYEELRISEGVQVGTPAIQVPLDSDHLTWWHWLEGRAGSLPYPFSQSGSAGAVAVFADAASLQAAAVQVFEAVLAHRQAATAARVALNAASTKSEIKAALKAYLDGEA